MQSESSKPGDAAGLSPAALVTPAGRGEGCQAGRGRDVPGRSGRSNGSSCGGGRTMAGIAEAVAKVRAVAAGAGRHDHAVPYLGQDYEALRQECLQEGRLFQDPSFPAGPTALGYQELGPSSYKTQGVVWRRPTVGRRRGLGGSRSHHAAAPPRLFARLFSSSSPPYIGFDLIPRGLCVCSVRCALPLLPFVPPGAAFLRPPPRTGSGRGAAAESGAGGAGLRPLRSLLWQHPGGCRVPVRPLREAVAAQSAGGVLLLPFAGGPGWQGDVLHLEDKEPKSRSLFMPEFSVRTSRLLWVALRVVASANSFP